MIVMERKTMTSRSNREVVASDWTAHAGDNDPKALQPNVSYLRWWSATVARTAVTERLSVEVVVNRVFASASSLGWSATIYIKKHEWGDGISHHYSRTEGQRTFKTLAGAKGWGGRVGAQIARIESII